MNEKETLEYESYWDDRIKYAIQFIIINNKKDKQCRIFLEEKNYGHFFNKNRYCGCGMTLLNFHNISNDEKWNNKEEYVCRRIRDSYAG